MKLSWVVIAEAESWLLGTTPLDEFLLLQLGTTHMPGYQSLFIAMENA